MPNFKHLSVSSGATPKGYPENYQSWAKYISTQVVKNKDNTVSYANAIEVTANQTKHTLNSEEK